MWVNRVLIAAMVIVAAAAARAHPSFAAEFLEDQTATIDGVVTEVWFKNPHVRYYVEIDTEDGKVTWDIRGKSPTSLIREGWTPKTIQEGDQISVHGHLGRDGRKLMSIISIKLADGTTLGLEY